MKNLVTNFKIFILLLSLSVVNYAQNSDTTNNNFTFVFATDIHITYKRNAVEGFKKAIKEINKINPDFVITGGDLIMDALGANYAHADSLYNLYIETSKLINAPVYNTIGNHEIFGIYKKSQVPRNHPEFGKKMFKHRIGKDYYSFTYKGIKFLILDSIEETPEGGSYFGHISQEQIEWIKNELDSTNKKTPIIISTHIPFVTVQTQLVEGSTIANGQGTVVTNSKEVLALFKDYNLKLVLQGHLHYFEDLNVMNKIHFITGGAVSARWWKGPNEGLQEGFLVVKVNNDKISTEYYDYGWEVKDN